MGKSKQRNYGRLSLEGILWWSLANLLAVSFALLSWFGCHYLFHFPEKELNFKVLQKLGRIGNLTQFTPLNAPGASSATPEDLYELFYSLGEKEMAAFNLILKRGYLTNYDKAPLYRYLKGEFRILEARRLTEDDLLSPGIVLKARAFVKSSESGVSRPYPVVIDYVIPTRDLEALAHFQKGDLLEVKKIPHCASVLHLSKEGRADDPTLRCVVVPLAYNDYLTPDRQELELARPQGINLQQELPFF